MTLPNDNESTSSLWTWVAAQILLRIPVQPCVKALKSLHYLDPFVTGLEREKPDYLSVDLQ